jgi:hypothetical protein
MSDDQLQDLGGALDGAPRDTSAAWVGVLRSVERALTTPGLPADHRRVLLRLRCASSRLAGEPRLRVLD